MVLKLPREVVRCLIKYKQTQAGNNRFIEDYNSRHFYRVFNAELLQSKTLRGFSTYMMNHFKNGRHNVTHRDVWHLVLSHWIWYFYPQTGSYFVAFPFPTRPTFWPIQKGFFSNFSVSRRQISGQILEPALTGFFILSTKDVITISNGCVPLPCCIHIAGTGPDASMCLYSILKWVKKCVLFPSGLGFHT